MTMQTPDWHDALSSLAAQFPAGEESPTPENAPDTPVAAVQKTPVHIFLERKGRGGKTATIICDLTLDDEDLRQLAAELKRSLGCGGSARGGEILIQGDRVAECRRMLAARGYKVK